MSLLQNDVSVPIKSLQFDYQSVCHCSKTMNVCTVFICKFDYQSVCHCSKT